MKIEVGQRLPDATLLRRRTDKTNEAVDFVALCSGRMIALVGMPGAFTGTCTGQHLPGLIEAAPELRANGVDEIIVFAVNDPQVMMVWGEVTGATNAGITLLADPESKLTEALGLRFDAPAAGMIGRCLRFGAIANDRVVEILKFEKNPLGCDLTSGDSILQSLKG